MARVQEILETVRRSHSIFKAMSHRWEQMHRGRKKASTQKQQKKALAKAVDMFKE
jgi:hypothetical protein